MPSIPVSPRYRIAQALFGRSRTVRRARRSRWLLAAFIAASGGFIAPSEVRAEHPWWKHFKKQHCDQKPVAPCDTLPSPAAPSVMTPGYEPFTRPTVPTPAPFADPNASGPGTVDPSVPPTVPPVDQDGGSQDGAVNSGGDAGTGDGAAADPTAPGDTTPDFSPDVNAPAPRLNTSALALAASSSSFSAAPTMTGDLLGGAVVTISGEVSRTVPGFILNAAGSGSPNALIGFDFGGGLPDDVFTTGIGTMVNGSPVVNRFSILEPIPPSDAPTSPGAGFTFNGGTATYQPTDPNSPSPFDSGDNWLVQYSYFALSDPEVQLAAPDVATRRVKISENFSPEVRNRFFMNYSFFNDAFGGLGDISRWVLGFERVLFDDMVSVELRQPMAAAFSSDQVFESPGDQSFELGNMSLIGKLVLMRRESFVWTVGTGITLPLADDSRLSRNGATILEIENGSVHLLPYTGLLLRAGRDSVFQAYMQYDVAVSGDPVRGDLTGVNLRDLGTFNDSTLVHLDASYHHTAFRGSRDSLLSEIIANFEMHYTGSLQEADFVSAEGLTVSTLGRSVNILNGTFGAHFVLNNKWVVTPGMSVPLRDGLDEQFDYEAIVQVNYLH